MRLECVWVKLDCANRCFWGLVLGFVGDLNLGLDILSTFEDILRFSATYASYCSQ